MSIVLLSSDKQSIVQELRPGGTVALPEYAGSLRIRWADVAAMTDHQLNDNWMGRVYEERDTLIKYQHHGPPTRYPDGVRWVENAVALEDSLESAISVAVRELRDRAAQVLQNGIVIDTNGGGDPEWYAESNDRVLRSVNIIGSALASGEPYPASGIDWLLIRFSDWAVIQTKFDQTQYGDLAQRLGRHDIKTRNALATHVPAVKALTSTADVRAYMETTANNGWPENPPPGALEAIRDWW